MFLNVETQKFLFLKRIWAFIFPLALSGGGGEGLWWWLSFDLSEMMALQLSPPFGFRAGIQMMWEVLEVVWGGVCRGGSFSSPWVLHLFGHPRAFGNRFGVWGVDAPMGSEDTALSLQFRCLRVMCSVELYRRDRKPWILPQAWTVGFSALILCPTSFPRRHSMHLLQSQSWRHWLTQLDPRLRDGKQWRCQPPWPPSTLSVGWGWVLQASPSRRALGRSKGWRRGCSQSTLISLPSLHGCRWGSWRRNLFFKDGFPHSAPPKHLSFSHHWTV